MEIRKFIEYDRIVTEQLGPLRIMMKKKQEKYSRKKPIYSSKTS